MRTPTIKEPAVKQNIVLLQFYYFTFIAVVHSKARPRLCLRISVILSVTCFQRRDGLIVDWRGT